MPRRPRLVIPGLPMHVIQRGNNRAVCFHDEQDFRYFIRHMAEQALLHQCDLHAWCLMSNHVHLLLTPATESAPGQMMKGLGQHYAQYYNRRYERTGTLFEGRFRSCLIGDERYLFTCYRYIEMNPVRAGMVAFPGDYDWSSYRHNALGVDSDIITPHPALMRLGSSIQERAQRYKGLFLQDLPETQVRALQAATKGNYALGSERFVGKVEERLNCRAKPVKRGRKPTKLGTDPI